MIWVPELDNWIVAAAVLCAVSAALLGNFLVLRRLSMLADAVSHAVLPGLAVAFLITGTRDSVPMFLGAVTTGVITAVLTEWIRRTGEVDEGAGMGVAFTSLFALGLILIVRAADHVDLDPGCVLVGSIELTPLDRISVGGFAVPRVIVNLGIVLIVNTLFVSLLYKELKITSFDPALATASGYSARFMHYTLMTLVAVTAVAGFESVGTILVVAMFVVPSATALLLSDRLGVIMWLSPLLAAGAAVSGHVAAIGVPPMFGYGSTSTTGMMAVMAGLGLFLAVVFGPQRGIVPRLIRQRRLSRQILADDVLALLYRMEERGVASANVPALVEVLGASNASVSRVLRDWQVRGHLVRNAEEYQLNDVGRRQARRLVRSHRLWEQYLLEAGTDVDQLHATAEKLEHFTSDPLRDRLDEATASPETDPHGRSIPQRDRAEDHH